MKTLVQGDKKEKIAIAIDKLLLHRIDALIDGTMLTSRSQAMTYFIEQGLKSQSIQKAVVLLHHTHHGAVLAQHPHHPHKLSYLQCQLLLFYNAGVKEIIILTQDSPLLQRLKQEADAQSSKLRVQFVIKNTKSTGDSVFAVKDLVKHQHFLVMSGDTFNAFDLSRMIRRHFESNLPATMGLVNKENVKNCGVVLLDGSYIIDFEQNAPSLSSPPHQPKSHIINAGLYIFSPEIFRFFDKNLINLERDLFPKLAKTKQLLGYFTHGEYRHLTENDRV